MLTLYQSPEERFELMNASGLIAQEVRRELLVTLSRCRRHPTLTRWKVVLIVVLLASALLAETRIWADYKHVWCAHDYLQYTRLRAVCQ
jgi:hypothetical protein